MIVACHLTTRARTCAGVVLCEFPQYLFLFQVSLLARSIVSRASPGFGDLGRGSQADINMLQVRIASKFLLHDNATQSCTLGGVCSLAARLVLDGMASAQKWRESIRTTCDSDFVTTTDNMASIAASLTLANTIRYTISEAASTQCKCIGKQVPRLLRSSVYIISGKFQAKDPRTTVSFVVLFKA